ncbi:uncharacterized protein LOC119075260 [Bradysia coprophila]|uniref:uncharacterized protein LOC119075260 n=1 Tax=Bradysia coprophila TaxID=38358 RepID=UPI00187DCAEB|nr:uncharacterized protein LOC119075260 [Bradysia coprophila]
MREKIEVELKKKEDLKRKVGRPTKEFDECAARTKRRKVQQVCESIPKDQIERAAIRNVKKPVAKFVKQILHSSVTEVKEHCYKATKEDIVSLTEAQAVSLLVEIDLSVHQYKTLRNVCKKQNADIFPPYYKVLEEKKQCYPKPSSIEITETHASIKLQALLDRTSERLLQSLSTSDLSKLPLKLTLMSKYGADGAAGQSQYKQQFKDDNNGNDAQVFMISVVPIRMVDETNLKSVYWQNDCTGSPRYCRPIKFMFAKECKELTNTEVQKIKEQIDDLESSMISIAEKRFFVKHKLFLSMVDGKTCAYVTNTDSSTSYVVCKATPNEMSDVDALSLKTVDETVYDFGLSPLHAKIRFMEFVLHLGYNMTFKNYYATVKNGYATEKSQNKARIQKGFKEEMGLSVDFVRQGSGTSNDGNTARRFFANPDVTARITQVDEVIIKRFRNSNFLLKNNYELCFVERLDVVLKTLACGRDINPEAFNVYSLDTYRMIVEKYNWYKMPWSVHRILMHGAATIKHNVLPIGQLTEEAAEARNKDFRRFREHHARKVNRVLTNQDILNALLVSSDPLISSLRSTIKKNHLELPNEVKDLLVGDDSDNCGDDVEEE